MRLGSLKTAGLAALLALMAWAPTLHAQEAQEAEEAARQGCRCVDQAGQEIENCVCVVTPDVRRILATVSPVRRARLGVEIDWEQGEQMDRQGVRIEDVNEGSPAEEAGLRAGDILVSVAGRHLLNPLSDEGREAALDEDRSLPVQRLLVLARELEPEEPVEIRYLRDGRERSTTVVPEESAFGSVARVAPRIRILADSMRSRGDSLRILGDRLRARLRSEGNLREREVRAHRHEDLTREHRARAREDRTRAREHQARAREMAERMRGDAVRLRALSSARSMRLGRPFGLELVELNPDLADYFDVDEGVLVAHVAERSELGLRPGDVIVAIGERAVEDVSDVRRILSSFEPEEDVRFRIVRQGDERTVTGHVDSRGRRDGF